MLADSKWIREVIGKEVENRGIWKMLRFFVEIQLFSSRF